MRSKSRMMLGVGVVLAVSLSGCTHLVHKHQFDKSMEVVHDGLAEQDERLGEIEAEVSSLSGSVAKLSERMEELARDFGGHVEDDDMHGMLGLALPVHFDFASSEIRAVDRPVLDAFAAAMMAFPGARVTVEGSTDGAGSAAANMRLSNARAMSVRDYLVENGGISSDNISVVGLGETRLLSEETGMQDAEAGMENRRVTFVVEWAG